MAMLESVPNVSEGRDPEVIEAIGRSFGANARVLDIHSDADHHRSVYTLVADEGELVSALIGGIARASELVDLRVHDGIHPRVGAADVVPIVPLAPGDLERANGLALELGRIVGDELGLPVFLYGASGGGRRPVFFRRGGPDELQRRIDVGELQPDFGPAQLDPRAGAVLIGARPLLIAFNLELETGDLADAQAIARAVRESSGGMPGVQALGLVLPSQGTVQVSLNLVDVDASPLVDVVERVRAVAAERGAKVGRSELVGLLPECAVADPERLGLDELPADRILERRLPPG